jgi:hypothetical protein
LQEFSSSSDSTITTRHDDCNNADDPFSQSDLTQTISDSQFNDDDIKYFQHLKPVTVLTDRKIRTFRLKDLCHVFSYVMCFRMYVMCFRMNGMCFRIMSCVFI